jgi:hypothetical protein
VVSPRRWVVKRTFAWLSQNRRMSKDYERLCATAKTFIYVAMTRFMMGGWFMFSIYRTISRRGILGVKPVF